MKWLLLKFNAIEFHEAWSGVLFAAAGALMVNVLTGFQANIQYIIALILAFGSLVFFTYFTIIKATTQKTYINKIENKKPEDEELAFDKFVKLFRKGENPQKANRHFILGSLCLIISAALVIQAKVESINADEKSHSGYIFFLESSKKIGEQLLNQNDTLREELLEQSDALRQQLLEQNDTLREQLLKQSETLQKQYELPLSGKTSTQIDESSKDAPQYDRPVDSQ